MKTKSIEGQHTLRAETVSKKDLLSAAEIADLRLPGLPTTKANVLVRAEKEGWRYQEVSGLGGVRKVFEVPTRYTETVLEPAVRELVELGYDRGRIATNFGIKLGRNHMRLDIVAFKEGAPHTLENVELIVECKPANSNPSDASVHLERFMAAVPAARWGIWTTGRETRVFRRSEPDGSLTLVPMAELAARKAPVDDRIADAREDYRGSGMDDADLLEAVIEGVERFAIELGDALSPQRKATLISLFYRYFRDEGRVDPQKLGEMLRRVA